MRFAPLALSVAALPLIPNAAEACGGLFCATTPVVQTEEAIVFDVDLPNNQVTAIINIVYQGSAEEFVWVLPLQTAPIELLPGSPEAFARLDQATRPTFRFTEFDTAGMCSMLPPTPGAVDAGSALDGGAPIDPGVNLISRQDVGPYDTVVLEGESREAVQTWLVDNGFRVTDEMMDLVTPYLAKGDTLLALKLRNDRDSGDIKPIEVVMQADPAAKTLEACIPIRMTAMAANTDMPITTYVFTDAGRAIPENFFHVKPNLLKIDWLRFGSNYRQIIAEAIDEADAGHAFVTEFSGSPRSLQVFLGSPSFDEGTLRSLTDLGAFILALQNQALIQRIGMRDILEKHFPEVAECSNCPASAFDGVVIEPGPAVDEIKLELIEPSERVQALIDGRSHLTRLLTILDPDEMTLDPMFSYSDTLPEVSNRHTARLIENCGAGGFPGEAGYVVVLENGQRILYDGDRQLDPRLASLPSAERIEQLHEGRLVTDNAQLIADALVEMETTPRPGLGNSGDLRSTDDRSACGCTSAGAQSGGLGLGALLLLFVFARRRR